MKNKNIKQKPCNRRMKKGKHKRKKPSASLFKNTFVVKPNQLDEAKPRKSLEKVI